MMRRSLHNPLPLETALIVIDVERAIDHPSWGQRNNPQAEQNIAALLRGWRATGRPIYHVRHDSTETESHYRPGQPGHEFKPETKPLPGEVVVPKQTNSAFIGTDLERMLREAKQNTMGVVDILQTDINHVGGITGLWKVSQMAAASGISMAPHACEGPIGGLATLHVNSAMSNFVVQEICGQIQPGATDKIWEDWLEFPAMRMVDGRFRWHKIPVWDSNLPRRAWPNIRLPAHAPWRASSTKMDR